jgi:fatty-acyl-CoA synthase
MGAIIHTINPRLDPDGVVHVIRVTAESVLRAYEGRVPKWWLPDEILVVNKLPHTPTGKVKKNALRAQYADCFSPNEEKARAERVEK